MHKVLVVLHILRLCFECSHWCTSARFLLMQNVLIKECSKGTEVSLPLCHYLTSLSPRGPLVCCWCLTGPNIRGQKRKKKRKKVFLFEPINLQHGTSGWNIWNINSMYNVLKINFSTATEIISFVFPSLKIFAGIVILRGVISAMLSSAREKLFLSI